MRILFSFFLSLFLFTVFCNQASAEGIAEQIQRRYTLVETMHSEFTQRLTHKESGSVKERAGSLVFKKPMLVRWETKAPSPELLVVGQKEIWNAFPDEELAYKYPVSMVDSSTNIIRVITGQSRLDQDFGVEETGRENGLIKVMIYPNEPTQSLVEATLWIEPTTAIIKKLLIFDFYGNQNEITFTRQDVGAPAADTLFRYSPPKSYTVEDRADGGQLLSR